MKKITLLIFLGLFLNGCGTTSSHIEKGSAKIGMNKEEFCLALFTWKWSQDPCNTPLTSSIYSAPGAYYPETKMEIMHDSKMEYFFVFENVNKPYNYHNIWEQGDGTLIKIFKDHDEAKKFASSKNFSISSSKIEKAKEAFKKIGLNEKTEEFADCTLKKIKE